MTLRAERRYSIRTLHCSQRHDAQRGRLRRVSPSKQLPVQVQKPMWVLFGMAKAMPRPLPGPLRRNY